MPDKCLYLKKYPNRRLYSEEDSAYVTTVAVNEAVMAGREVRVTAHPTGDDITREILLDVLVSKEKRLLRVSTAIIVKLIRTGTAS